MIAGGLVASQAVGQVGGVVFLEPFLQVDPGLKCVSQPVCSINSMINVITLTL